MGPYTAYAIVWISVTAAVIIGVWLTNSPGCLWALLIPAFINVELREDEKE